MGSNVPYESTSRRAPVVSFRQAVLDGLAPDGGLYMPVEIPPLPLGWCQLHGLPEVASEVARPLLDGDIADDALATICADAFSFPVPLVPITGGIDALELFWGPTFSFKDLGARFLARLLDHFATRGAGKLTVLVATSGDTGSAVAHGFAGMLAIDVVLLYPSGRVSPLQEKQLTTAGGSVAALEVAGTFDDCQAMVKAAFADRRVREKRPLTSANSINIGRLLAQVFYYVHACALLAAEGREPAFVCVPSGNFGNLTAALLARAMGCPIDRVVAATNANDTVPRYLATGVYAPRPVIETPANAMDVSDPSNFARIRWLFGNQRSLMAEAIHAIAVSTPEMMATIERVRREHGYLLDPHAAAGFAGLERVLAEARRPAETCVLAATAHPGKFGEAIRAATGGEPNLPPALAAVLTKEKHSTVIGNRAEYLVDYLLDTPP